MRILLFGRNGQVGWELQRALAPLGELISLDINSKEYCGDFRKPEQLAETIRKIKPQVIVNAVAYTAVDKAESESEIARQINTDSVEVLAKEAETLGAWLIHYSTDYVFNGDGDIAWLETDQAAPLNVYGATKLAGELAIQQYCSHYLIFRTSWVYAVHGNNFVKTMLRLAKEQSELSVINDQYGAPTGAELLADCTAHAIRIALKNPNVTGLYHLTASGTTTWYDFANFIFDEAHKINEQILVHHIFAIPTSAYPRPAVRPYNSRLNTTKFQQTFDLILPDWQSGVKRMILELLGKL